MLTPHRVSVYLHEMLRAERERAEPLSQVGILHIQKGDEEHLRPKEGAAV